MICGAALFSSAQAQTNSETDSEFKIFKCKATQVVASKHFAKFDVEKFSEVTLFKNRNTGAFRAKVGDQEYSEAKKDRFMLAGPFGKNEWVTIWPSNSDLEIEIAQLGADPVRVLAVRESAEGKAIFVADLDCRERK